MLGNLVEGFICRSEHCEVGSGAIEKLYKVVVLADELRKLGRVLRFSDQLIDRQVRLARVAMMGWSMVRWMTVVWRSVVRVFVRRMSWILEVILIRSVVSRLKPALSVKGGLVG